MSNDEVLDTLFEGRPHALAPIVAAWLVSSRRFARFVHDHHTKIRKKLRAVQDRESVRDLHLELETAYQFSHDKALTPAYEPVTGTSRGPDFAVRYTTSLEFMVEVTRLRGDRDATTATVPRQADAIDDDAAHDARDALSERRLAGVLASKLGQTVAGHANLLIVGMDAPPPTSEELDAALRRIRRRVEVSGADALRRQGFADRGAYLRRAERLSAILVRRAPDLSGEPQGVAGSQVTLWSNPQAAVPLSSKVRSAVLRVVATRRTRHL
jgi:hypothetical protein